jgi:16S rRNA (cytosine1402-N4)-methyltransferase
LDVDPRNLNFARERLSTLPSQLRLFEANFAEIETVWDQMDRPPIDAVLVDLGVSTNQLFDPAYGLSFAAPMPLDMRLDPSLPQSAADVVNRMSESQLADVLYELAQERHSRRIARKIVEARRLSPIYTTDRLADIVRSAVPSRGPKSREKIDPATA